MGDDLRDRFFTPFVLPVTIIGVMLLVGISLSRVLLTVSELGASFVALLAAGYIMLAAFWVEARKRISARSLGVALAIGLIGLVGAGAAASAAGMRDLEEHSASEEGGGGDGEGGGETASNEPVFVAIDIEYESAPSELPTGDVDLTFENNGAIEHNVTIEELGDETVLDAAGGDTDEATVTLEAGEYTYYCSVPGHRATMEGTFTVSDSAEAAAGGDEAPSEPGADTSEAGAAAEGASEG
ncbi:MAG TPA: plastocyanin/azurin family copper-binding protein [Euzebyales bacterium]